MVYCSQSFYSDYVFRTSYTNRLIELIELIELSIVLRFALLLYREMTFVVENG